MRRWMIVAVILGLAVWLVPANALANDDVTSDGDDATTSRVLALGNVCPGRSYGGAGDVELRITKQNLELQQQLPEQRRRHDLGRIDRAERDRRERGSRRGDGWHRTVGITMPIETRAGSRTGEVELVGDKVEGIAVHTGARVCTLAGPSEVLVTSTVKDLVAGSGLGFEDAGEHELKGVPDRWRLYRVSGREPGSTRGDDVTDANSAMPT